MNVYDSANALANELRQCDEVREYARLKEVAEADETNRRLLAEFRKMHMKMQLQAASGGQADAEEMQRFQQIASLLYMNNDVQAYMLAEMRLQKLMADIFKSVTDACGMDMGIPGE